MDLNFRVKVDIILQREEGGQLLAVSSFPSLPRYPHTDKGLGSLKLENLPEDVKQTLKGIRYLGKEIPQ